MILQEYDENLHISNEKEISYQEGLEEGLEKGREEEKENTLRERNRADEANQRAEIFRLKLQGKNEEEIAEIVNLQLETVQEILNFCI